MADETETHLFRIAQEALTNVARHAEATEVMIHLQRVDGEVRLEIHDNGQGVLPAAQAGRSLNSRADWALSGCVRGPEAPAENWPSVPRRRRHGRGGEFPRAGERGNMKKIRIVLADDHSVVRQGFRRILEAQPDMEIVGEASNGREALEQAAKLTPDVVVMDVAMPELNGIEATRRLSEATPHSRVLALSMHKDSVYVREILRAGARGYLLKDAVDEDLIAAVRAVSRGEGYLSPGVADAVLTDYRQHVSDPIDLLTTREREVLQLIAEGKTNKDIATLLKLSVYTVDAHRGRVMEKLNLHSTGELVRFAVRKGLVD